MKATNVPTSKAKTAYGLLSEIAALALAEPKRIAMNDWLVTRGSSRTPALGFPACGTVACVAGWAVTLRPTKAREKFDQWSGLYETEDAGDRAQRVLGLSDKQADRLFRPTSLMCASNLQTPAHARATVRHIRQFQKRYKAQLLAKKV